MVFSFEEMVKRKGFNAIVYYADPAAMFICRKTGVPVQFVNRKQIEKISSTKNHQGIIGYAQTDAKWGLGKVLRETGKDVCVVILDQVQDPHNLGAIIRTAEGAGVDGGSQGHQGAWLPQDNG